MKSDENWRITAETSRDGALGRELRTVSLSYVTQSCVVIVGNRVVAGTAGLDSMAGVHKTHSQLAGPITVTADVEPLRDDYYSSVGRKNAVAFNRHAFSDRNAHSVIHAQPF